MRSADRGPGHLHIHASTALVSYLRHVDAIERTWELRFMDPPLSERGGMESRGHWLAGAVSLSVP